MFRQQTSRVWELVFVDDGSTDGTLEIARDFAARVPVNFRILQHPEGANRGISASRNLAIRYAHGALLAFLDSDDVWLSHHLETQAELLDRMPHVAMIYADAERWVDFSQPFDEHAARSSTWSFNYIPPLVPAGERRGLLPRGRLIQWFRADESLVPCICTVLVRTEVARSVGGFCDSFRGLFDDQVFHVKVAMKYDVYANDVCVARYRQHDDSCCGRARSLTQESDAERDRFGDFLQKSLEAQQ